jgi:hypothetical protein
MRIWSLSLALMHGSNIVEFEEVDEHDPWAHQV